MNAPTSINTQNIYEIKIQGQMDASWLDWMETVDVQTQFYDDVQFITIFSNLITDQAGLVGLTRRHMAWASS